MFKTTDETQRAAAALLADLSRHGIDLPPGIAEAVEEAERATAGLAALAREVNTAASASIVAAAINGTKTAPDTLGRVLAALLTERPTVAHALTYERATAVVHAIRAESTELLAALQPRFTAAAADLDAAATVLRGVDDLGDLQAVTNVGGDAAGAWKKARAAETVLTGVVAMIQRLGMVGVYEGVNDPRDRLLVVADLDLPGYKKVGAKTSPWELRSLGRLALATPDEHQARKAHIDAEWARDPDNRTTRIPVGVGQIPVAATVPAFGEVL